MAAAARIQAASRVAHTGETRGQLMFISKKFKLINCVIVFEGYTSNFEAHNLGKSPLPLGLSRYMWFSPITLFPICIPVDIPFD